MLNFPNAKINIGLNITERRADGYHNLETVFYPIKINDALEVLPADELSFHSTGIEIPGRLEDNLCIKGYHLIKYDHPQLPPVKIHLHKNIPIGAGLGGGSADAAFFIKLLDQTFNLGLSLTDMLGYARRLGADCSFFIESKPVLAYGIGDEFTPLPLDLSPYHIALVMPDAHVSSGEAFRGVKPMPVTVPLSELIQRPITEWRHHIKNDFETSVFKNHPGIRGVKAALYNAGALYASMSGSGASVFGIFDKEPDLKFLEEENRVFYGV